MKPSLEIVLLLLYLSVLGIYLLLHNYFVQADIHFYLIQAPNKYICFVKIHIFHP
ncbi:unnamed protein product [Meloidogyne enterolobii]|uniref:Uncharacterized protein n=1 Tax=Meloidogyne enterolobii TaxID=390850 RepID=A0ACB0ZA73_MELEN